MFLLVGLSTRHVLPTANQLQVGESCERGFLRQTDGTVPAVSPKNTSAHPFTILRRWHCTFLTHLTVHEETCLVQCVYTFLCPIRLVEHVESTNFTSCANLVQHNILLRGSTSFLFAKSRYEVSFISQCQDISFGLLRKYLAEHCQSVNEMLINLR